MTEIQKPPDPYALIGEHWTPLSATECRAVSKHIFDLTIVHENAAAATIPTAAQVQAEFISAAGDRLLESLNISVAAIRGHAGSAERIAGLMGDLSDRIKAAKTEIRSTTLAATETLSAAKEKDRPALATPYRDEISDRAEQLAGEVRSLASSIAAATPGDPSRAGVHVFELPVKAPGYRPDGGYQAVNATGQALRDDGTVLSDKPIVKMPEHQPLPQKPVAPASGTPTSPGAMPQMPGQMPQMPVQGGGQPVQQSGSASGANSSGAGANSGSQSAQSDTGSHGDAPTTQPDGLSGAPVGGLNQQALTPAVTAATTATTTTAPIAAKAAAGLTTAATTPTTALSGMSGMSAPTSAPGMGSLAGSALSSTAPAGTGVTPGAPAGHGGRGQVVVAPVPTAPTATGTPTVVAPGSVAGTATPAPSAAVTTSDSHGGAGGERAPRIIPPHLVATTPADQSSIMQLSSYVRDLPADEQMAHRRVATLVDQFRRAGWGGEPVALGVYAFPNFVDGADFATAIFATADGVSLIPRGVHLPDRVMRLTDLAELNPAAVAAMAGCADPVAKLRQLVPPRYGPPLTIATPAEINVTAILRAGDQAPVTTPRDRLRRIGDEAMRALDGELNTALMRYGRPELATATAELQALRWAASDGKPAGYDMTLRRYLIADALASAGTDRGEVAYAIGELQLSPELETDR